MPESSTTLIDVNRSPVVASSSLTVPSPALSAQTCVPSSATAAGPFPTASVALTPTVPPVIASSDTVPSPVFVTHASAPSDQIPVGSLPTCTGATSVPKAYEPSLALSTVTVPSPELATHTYWPSE